MPGFDRSLSASSPSAPRRGRNGMRAQARRPAGAAPTILVYHHLAGAACRLTDQLGVTTAPEVFRAHLRHAARHYDLVAPGDLLGGRPPKRPLLITFDDAYRSVLEVAGPILREFAASAVFFVNPASVVEDRLPTDNLLCLAWHELGPAELGWLLGADRPVRSVQEAILGRVSRLDLEAIAGLRERICARLGRSEQDLRRSFDLFLTAADLRQCAASGIEVGNHSMHHAFLRCLSPVQLETEIGQAKTLLERLSGQTVTWFSVPYGDAADATPAVLNAARRSRHSGICLVQGRLNRFRPSEDVFYRISPGNVSPAILPITLRVLPVLRSLRHTRLLG